MKKDFTNYTSKEISMEYFQDEELSNKMDLAINSFLDAEGNNNDDCSKKLTVSLCEIINDLKLRDPSKASVAYKSKPIHKFQISIRKISCAEPHDIIH